MKGDSRLGGPEMRTLQLLRAVPELHRKLSGIEGLLQLRGEPAWLMAPYKIDVR